MNHLIAVAVKHYLNDHELAESSINNESVPTEQQQKKVIHPHMVRVCHRPSNEGIMSNNRDLDFSFHVAGQPSRLGGVTIVVVVVLAINIPRNKLSS